VSKRFLTLLLVLATGVAVLLWTTRPPEPIDRPIVLLDRATGVYHTGGCTKRGQDVLPMSVVEASEKFHACPVCCPMCAMLGGSRESIAAAAFAPPPETATDAGSGPGGAVQVKGYRRKDGTAVRPHTRKR
jgi:hypothetical protein